MIKFIKKNCVGCRICEIICSLAHDREINCKTARIRYNDDWPRIGTVVYCRQCTARHCMKNCPQEGALYVNEQGLITLDREHCDGCMKCSEACPFNTLPVDDPIPLFCDTCFGDYNCVKWCPNKALVKEG